jgi:glycosyltransferase involved in cell wall biosynthesis
VSDKIKLVGTLKSKEIANYMRTCTAFMHPSNYETFSVVCAEAVSCNTPVIASKVGGITEVVKEGQGILLSSFKTKKWKEALSGSPNYKFKEKKGNQYSKEQIGDHYYQVLKEIISMS